MNIQGEKRPAITPITITLETRQEMLALLDIVRNATGQFFDGSVGEKLVGEIYKTVDQHVIHFGGHSEDDIGSTGYKKY